MENMKVKELIKRLKTVDQECEVSTEGCDCFGDIGYIVQENYEGVSKVFLNRTDGDFYQEEIEGQEDET